MEENTVFAFISYSRKNKNIANWLHKRLENYEYPKNIVNQEQFPPHDKYIRRVFLDTKDMQVEDRPFTDRIKNALEEAKFLIILCSKDSAKSTFVDKEIRYFLEKHNNNYSLIVPLFIDEVKGETIPNAIMNTSIMNRHFPIYNTTLNEESEANGYCYYQIVAYLLGVNFSEIYNRYEIDAKKKNKREKRRMVIAIITLFLIIMALGYAVYQRNRTIEFEKKVFPAAVVHGYEENFLTPVISHLKNRNEKFMIFVMMPTSLRELQHRNRIIDINYIMKNELNIDSLTIVHLPTATKRGNHIHRLMKNGQVLPYIYLDFASTTSSFAEIAKYKKRHYTYQQSDIDEIINEYTREFILQTQEELNTDSVFVKFYTDRNSFFKDIKAYINTEK